MNRQYCILLYSNHSNECKKLFLYIDSLPFDLLSTTGLSLCCVDNVDMRNTIEKCGITDVPTLLSKYFDQNQQQLVGASIYDWIATIAQRMGYQEDGGIEKESTTADFEQSEPERVATNDEPVVSDKSKVLSLALSMQKTRDNEMGLAKKTRLE